MKVIKTDDLRMTERDVRGVGFNSIRFLLESDNMGFTVCRTEIEKGKYNWHYKDHLEACYCVSGEGEITNLEKNEKHKIKEGYIYVLDEHDNHAFEAFTDVVLISVFNPPLTGKEVHNKDNSYELPYRSPVYNVKAIPFEKIVSNEYNPNSVAPPEMKLLYESIKTDGYTMPIVVSYNQEKDVYEIVDGFHRWRTMKENMDIYERENGLMPCSIINKDISDRMASTIRHNRARGTHMVDLMKNIVAELVQMGKSDQWVQKKLGMSPDEVLRFKQITGLTALFENKNFSIADE